MPAGFKSRSAKGRVDLSRPVVDLNRTIVDREWRNLQVQDLAEGDTVAGMGLVQAVTFMFDTHEIMLTVGYPEAKAKFFSEGEILFAFVKKEN